VQNAELSLADRAYGLLRKDLLAGEFAPGQPLRLGALKDRYDLSFSPIREALTRLAAEKLVVLSSLRGFRVAEISLSEMWDVISTRILIESEALRQSIANGDESWEAEVVGTYHALTRSNERTDPDLLAVEKIEHHHMAFHNALIRACGSPSLLHIAHQLYTQSERYRRPTLIGLGKSDIVERDVMAEHREIMEHTVARNTDAAVAFLALHYRRTGKSIEAILLARE
jgi:GntR family carbon starvation induced transcriptional regulator